MNEDKFNKLCEDVAVMKSQLNEFSKTSKIEIKDHEKRIRMVEDFKAKAIGAVAVASVLGGIIGGLIQFLAGKI